MRLTLHTINLHIPATGDKLSSITCSLWNQYTNKVKVKVKCRGLVRLRCMCRGLVRV